MLYNVNNNTHWTPSTKSTLKSHKITIKYVTTNNIISFNEIIDKKNIFINNLKTLIQFDNSDREKNHLFDSDNINYKVIKQRR